MAKNTFHQYGALIAFSLLFITIFGCGAPKDSDQTEGNSERPQVTLKVLVVDDPNVALAAKRRWSAEGMGEAQTTEMTRSEFIESDFQIGKFDVAIYPSVFQPDLIARGQLMAVPKKVIDGELVGKKELLPHQRKILMRYGGEVWGVPLGEAQLMLMYDQDLFDELSLAVPTTWQEYELVAKALKDKGHQVAEPTEERWAAKMLLSRVASSIRAQGELATVFDFESMKPLIDSEPFVRALDQMKACVDGEQSDDPQSIFQKLVKGEVAMGVTWPSIAFVDLESETDAEAEEGKWKANEKLSVARLPGSKEWFEQRDSEWQKREPGVSVHVDVIGGNGLMASVNKTSGNGTMALEFVGWVGSKQTSNKVSVQSPNVSMYRATHLAQPSRWCGDLVSVECADQFSDVVGEISESGVVFLFPRVNSQSEYLQALGAAVQAGLKGGQSKAVLEEAAGKWEQITERNDRDEQRKMLRSSEGFSG